MLERRVVRVLHVYFDALKERVEQLNQFTVERVERQKVAVAQRSYKRVRLGQARVVKRAVFFWALNQRGQNARVAAKLFGARLPFVSSLAKGAYFILKRREMCR